MSHGAGATVPRPNIRVGRHGGARARLPAVSRLSDRTAGRVALADPRLLVVTAAVLWGTTGTARALGPDDASPTAVGAVRLMVGGACLVAAARWGRWLTTTPDRSGASSGPGDDGGGGHRRAVPSGEPATPVPSGEPGTSVPSVGPGDDGGGGHRRAVPSGEPATPVPSGEPATPVPSGEPATPVPSGGPGDADATGTWRTHLGVGVAALAMAAYQPLFFGGVARTGVAVGTVVGIGSSPVFAGVLGIGVRGERPGGRWLAATALALAGTGLLVGTGSSDDVDPAGIALALGAGLAYAVYVLASKLVLDAGWPPDALTVRVFGWAGLALVPVALVAGIGPLLSPGGLLMVAHLGIVTVAVAYVLFGRGLQGVGVGTAGTLTLAEPATAALLGIVVVGERFGGTTALGVALIATGLVVLVARRR
jgi:drug/metabolite transporter, DME family